MRIAIAVLIVLAALTGCGKKGPLILPDTPPASTHTQAPTPPPTNESV